MPTSKPTSAPTSTRRLAVAVLGASLLMSACGARLSEEQRAAALSQSVGRSSGSGGSAGGSLEGGLTGEGSFDPTTGEAVDAGGGVPADGTAPGGTSGSGGRSGGTAGAPAGGGGGGTGGAAPGADTRAAPPGGNGGATDKGVTATEIVIGNASDISGAVPGLFEDAQLATKAFVAYFTAKEGTIYGRKLKLLNLDTRMDTGANRAASLQICNEAFAGVGSVSAFDQGAAPVLKECGVPDIRGLATTDQMKGIPNVVSINAAGAPGHRGMGNYGWAATKFPDAVKAAAYLYIDGEVTRQLAEQDIEAAEALHGYKFIYRGAVGVTETNYAPFVQQMEDAGVRYVTFVGAYQQAASIAKTMQTQGFSPDVWQPTVTAYTPNYVKLAGPAATGTYVAVAPALLEEIGSNNELKLYAQWLNQVEPGATPTGIGQYAWAAAALFVEKAKKIGPNLTRKAMIDEVSSVRAYTGNGLFPPNDVGGRMISDCTQIVQVRDGKFVRVEPAQVGSHRCGDGVYDTRSDRRISGG